MDVIKNGMQELLGNKFPESSYMLFFCIHLWCLPNISNAKFISVSCHRLKQMAKPAGASIRESPTALGAFGNVLNVTSKVQGKALGRRGAKTAKGGRGKGRSNMVGREGKVV